MKKKTTILMLVSVLCLVAVFSTGCLSLYNNGAEWFYGNGEITGQSGEDSSVNSTAVPEGTQSGDVESSGKPVTKASACATVAACFTSSSLAFSLPQRKLSFIVPENKVFFCKTTATLLRRTSIS